MRDEKIKNLRVRVSNGEYPWMTFIKLKITFYTEWWLKTTINLMQLSFQLNWLILLCFLGHNQSGHNGFQRTYAAIKRIYYWKGYAQRIFLDIVKVVHSVHETSGGEEKVHRTVFQTWGTTHGIHFHGPGW